VQPKHVEVAAGPDGMPAGDLSDRTQERTARVAEVVQVSSATVESVDIGDIERREVLLRHLRRKVRREAQFGERMAEAERLFEEDVTSKARGEVHQQGGAGGDGVVKGGLIHPDNRGNR